MPGSGDSVQALKAGIMEIPDVIAINKMDQPGAKAMLNDIRGVISLDPGRGIAADRPHGGAARGGNRRALEHARRAPRRARGRRASSTRAGGGTWPRRSSRPRRPGQGGIEACNRARSRSCRARSRRCSGARSTRSRRSTGSSRRASRGLRDGPTRRSPTSNAARARLEGVARVTPCSRPARSAGSSAARWRSRPRTCSSRARSRSAARTTRSRS